MTKYSLDTYDQEFSEMEAEKEQKSIDFKTNKKISLKPSDNGKTGDIGWGEDFKDMVAE